MCQGKSVVKSISFRKRGGLILIPTIVPEVVKSREIGLILIANGSGAKAFLGASTDFLAFCRRELFYRLSSGHKVTKYIAAVAIFAVDDGFGKDAEVGGNHRGTTK